MWEVKHFVGGTTRGAISFLDNEIKTWFRETNIDQIVQVTETFGQAPTGSGGALENAIFVSIWYRPKE